MKQDTPTKQTGKLVSTINRGIQAAMPEGDHRRVRHYRLDFINENTFTRVWSVRMTRWRVALAALVVLVGVATIITALFFFTPLGRLLPGRLSRSARTDYIEMTMKLDSLERRVATTSAYAENVRNILNGRATHDPREVSSDEIPVTLPVDSLLETSEAERRFVQRYESDESYNLSVLMPIAMQSMTFVTPVTIGPEGYVVSDNPVGVAVPFTQMSGVGAVYRGTVISRTTDQWGRYTVTVQHPNDFLSIYSGLDEAFVGKGDKVIAGQRLGHVSPGGQLWLELWHNGSPVPLAEYIPLD